MEIRYLHRAIGCPGPRPRDRHPYRSLRRADHGLDDAVTAEPLGPVLGGRVVVVHLEGQLQPGPVLATLAPTAAAALRFDGLREEDHAPGRCLHDEVAGRVPQHAATHREGRPVEPAGHEVEGPHAARRPPRPEIRLHPRARPGGHEVRRRRGDVLAGDPGPDVVGDGAPPSCGGRVEAGSLLGDEANAEHRVGGGTGAWRSPCFPGPLFFLFHEYSVVRNRRRRRPFCATEPARPRLCG